MAQATLELSDKIFAAIQAKYPAFAYENVEEFMAEAVALRVEALLQA